MRETYLKIKVTDDLRKRLKQYAAECGLSMQSVVTTLLLDATRRVTVTVKGPKR